MSAAKEKGTKFETSLVSILEKYWPGTIRNPGNGVKDKGDFYMPGNKTYIIEAKCRKVMDLPGWTAEAQVEAANAGVPFGVVVHKRAGRVAPEEQWVTMRLGHFLALVHRGAEQ